MASERGTDGIEAVLFDLGNVILRFDHLDIARPLARTSTIERFRDPTTILRGIFHPVEGLTGPFDRGEVSPEEFYGRLVRAFGLEVSFEEFRCIWNGIFVEDGGVSEIIRELKGKVPLYLLSNTNLLHFEHIRGTFPIVHLLQGWFLSFELGIMKPAEGIYDKVLHAIGVSPERVLYIDDRWENLEPARNRGVHVIHHQSARGLRRALGAYFPVLRVPLDGSDSFLGNSCSS